MTSAFAGKYESVTSSECKAKLRLIFGYRSVTTVRDKLIVHVFYSPRARHNYYVLYCHLEW